MPEPDAFSQAQAHFKGLFKSKSFLGQSMKGEDQHTLRNGDLAHIIDKDQLRGRIFGKVMHPTPEHEGRYFDKILGAEGQPGRRAILLNIIAFGTADMVAIFESRFLSNKYHQTDEDLPMKQDETEKIFGKADGRLFYQHQFWLKAATLEQGNFSQKFQALEHTPYLGKHPIGRGANGTVYRVKIARGQYYTRVGDTSWSNSEDTYLARKDFRPKEYAYQSFIKEVYILRKLGREAHPKSILDSICSVEHDVGGEFPVASIFFREAQCTLYQYITDDRNCPRTDTVRLHNLHQMICLCDGLAWLNKNGFYHNDLKPDNVLVCMEPIASFKLADFGEARHRPDYDPGTSQEGKTSRQGTYLAPETQERVSASLMLKSDVWAFGCILLLVLLFNFEGAKAIDYFEDERVKGHSEGDFFYGMGCVCNTAVTECIHHLTANINAKPESQPDDDISLARGSLNHLEKKVFVEASKRATMSQLFGHLSHLYKERPLIVSGMEHKSFPNKADHCGHAPSGMSLVFSPTSILVYRENRPDFYRLLQPSYQEQEWSKATKPSSNACGNDLLCIALGKKDKSSGFRVGSSLESVNNSPTTDTPTKYALHSLHEGKGIQPIVKELKDLKIHVEQVALSPDGSVLAVACRPRDHVAIVRIYKGVTSSVNSGTTTPSHSLSEVNGILDFRFSGDGERLYCLYDYYKPFISALNRPQANVKVWRTADQSVIEEFLIGDEDLQYRGFFLKTIVPFNNSVGFMCITHEKYIRKRTPGDHSARRICLAIPGVSQLKSILITPDDKRFLILQHHDSKYSKYLRIYGGDVEEMRLTVEKPEEISTIKYTPSKDSAYIRKDESGLGFLLILMSYEDKTTYRINVNKLLT
ncbi:kinase-like domain-containing protein [Stachybotrys elegans]|uniref:Kinase-like domain-containing protein n=1 Tax=Stachybotrys elegans TaxID=80388 RepID=A0A8K0WMI7_9HYPO|nr:kinase-like domain-containing protein [Stachybotrys elegans]